MYVYIRCRKKHVMERQVVRHLSTKKSEDNMTYGLHSHKNYLKWGGGQTQNAINIVSLTGKNEGGRWIHEEIQQIT